MNRRIRETAFNRSRNKSVILRTADFYAVEHRRIFTKIHTRRFKAYKRIALIYVVIAALKNAGNFELSVLRKKFNVLSAAKRKQIDCISCGYAQTLRKIRAEYDTVCRRKVKTSGNDFYFTRKSFVKLTRTGVNTADNSCTFL